MNSLRKLMLLAPACLALATSGCATTTAIAARIDPARVACASFQPIRWSVRDTDATIAEVKQHNAAFKAICGDARP